MMYIDYSFPYEITINPPFNDPVPGDPFPNYFPGVFPLHYPRLPHSSRRRTSRRDETAHDSWSLNVSFHFLVKHGIHRITVYPNGPLSFTFNFLLYPLRKRKIGGLTT